MSTSAALVIDRHARQRLKRHFNKLYLSLWPQILMFLGALCPVFGLYNLERLLDFVLLGIFLGGIGWFWHFWCGLFVASQKEFDHIAETDFIGAQSVALERFDVAASDLIHAEPCKFRKVTTTRPIGAAFVGLRVGSDEKPRRSPHEYLIVNFGKSHLLLFRCVWDLTSGTTLWEETHEFAYRDIASVLLTHKKDTFRVNMRVRREIVPLWKAAGIAPINGRIQLPGDESVALRLVNGEQVPLFDWKRSSGGIPSGEGKKSFAAAQRLQKLVRELKQPRVAGQGAAGIAPGHAPSTIRDIGNG